MASLNVKRLWCTMPRHRVRDIGPRGDDRIEVEQCRVGSIAKSEHFTLRLHPT